MKKAHIILIDDQIDVLATLMQDLSIFRERFILDDCESVKEAYELLEELETAGESIALIICDHIMPNKNGIEFLSELSKDDRFDSIHKVLVTGQASHGDTIDAINNASIDYYISKPWVVENLHSVIKEMVTGWIMDNDLDYREYEGLIDTKILFKKLKGEAGTKH